MRLSPALAAASDVRYNPANCQADADLRGLLERVLRSEGVPVELTALVWVESSYSIGSYSTAGAAGPWQFMGGTARSCDLHMADRVDERYSWVASTRAASRYLDYLHGMFGDWQLAIAAYNCGEGTMQRALAGGQAALNELGLPRETSTFVPRFANALEAYSQLGESGGGLSVVIVPPGLDLRVLAAETGIDPDVLSGLNRGVPFRNGTRKARGLGSGCPHRQGRAGFPGGVGHRTLAIPGEGWRRLGRHRPGHRC
jgi:soluble lytic murein transglycosylase-like protein